MAKPHDNYVGETLHCSTLIFYLVIDVYTGYPATRGQPTGDSTRKNVLRRKSNIFLIGAFRFSSKIENWKSNIATWIWLIRNTGANDRYEKSKWKV